MIFKRNKKGSIQDLVLIIGLVLFFAISVLVAFKISSGYNDFVQDSDIFDIEGQQASEKITGYFPGVIDNTFLFFTIGLALVSFALATAVRFHPVFIVFFIIALIFLIFISGVASNVYQEMAAQPVLADEADQLTFINTIVQRLPMIVGIFGTLLMIIMYRQWQVNRV